MGLEGKRILLTGGGGFIGGHLAEALAGANEVVILDVFRHDTIAKTDLPKRDNVRIVRGDVLDRQAVGQAIEGCTHVVHLAAIAGVDTVLNMPVKTMEVNLYGTFHVLQAARALPRLERFIDISSSEVFGTLAYRARESEATRTGPVGEARWTYSVSKLATEHLTISYTREFGLPGVCVRPFNVYGPRQAGEGAIHHFVRRAIAGEELQIHNDGSQIRAWCHVDDMVRALLACLERPEAVGETFNIGNPRSTTTIYQLAREVVRIARSSSPLRFVRWDALDVELRVPNIEKAQRLLEFEPKVDLEEGLERTIQWYRGR